MCYIEAHEVHLGKGLDCTPVVCRRLEYHAGDGTILLSCPPILREHPGGGQGPPTSLPLPPTTREDLRRDSYLEYPHAAKALYIYKHPCLLRDSNPGPTAPSQRR
ncbi:uncharacterized protein TNCV_3742131 [Trichonephila clavipes]|nr:uncharacterized protein TNCV_3742131 [Trichonephila clavipes]